VNPPLIGPAARAATDWFSRKSSYWLAQPPGQLPAFIWRHLSQASQFAIRCNLKSSSRWRSAASSNTRIHISFSYNLIQCCQQHSCAWRKHNAAILLTGESPVALYLVVSSCVCASHPTGGEHHRIPASLRFWGGTKRKVFFNPSLLLERLRRSTALVEAFEFWSPWLKYKYKFLRDEWTHKHTESWFLG
jgi:hypothetical protein